MTYRILRIEFVPNDLYVAWCIIFAKCKILYLNYSYHWQLDEHTYDWKLGQIFHEKTVEEYGKNYTCNYTSKLGDWGKSIND